MGYHESMHCYPRISKLLFPFLVFFIVFVSLYRINYAFATSSNTRSSGTSLGSDSTVYTIANGVTVTQSPKNVYENTSNITLLFNIPASSNNNTPYYILFWNQASNWPDYNHCETIGSEFLLGGWDNAMGIGGWSGGSNGKCTLLNPNDWGKDTYTLVQDKTAKELTPLGNKWGYQVSVNTLPGESIKYKIWQGDVESSYQASQMIGQINIGQCTQSQNGCPGIAVDSYPVQYDTNFPLYIANPHADTAYIVWWKGSNTVIWSGSFTTNQIKSASKFNVIGSNNSTVSVPAIKLQNNGQDVTQIVSSSEDSNLPIDSSNDFKYKTLCLYQATPQNLASIISNFSLKCDSTAKSTRVYFGINGQPLGSGTLLSNGNIGAPSASENFNLQSVNTGFFLPCISPTPTPVNQAYNSKNSSNTSFADAWKNILADAAFFFTGQSAMPSPTSSNINQQLAYSQITPAQTTPEFLMSTTNQSTTPISVGPASVSPGDTFVVGLTSPISNNYTLSIHDGSNNSLLNSNITQYCQSGKACDFIINSSKYSNYKFTFPTNPQNFQITIADNNKTVGMTDVAFTQSASSNVNDSQTQNTTTTKNIQNDGTITIQNLGNKQNTGSANIYSDDALSVYISYNSKTSIKNCSVAIAVNQSAITALSPQTCNNSTSPNSNTNLLPLDLSKYSQFASITTPTDLSLSAVAYDTNGNILSIKKDFTIYPVCGTQECNGSCINVPGQSQIYCAEPTSTPTLSPTPNAQQSICNSCLASGTSDCSSACTAATTVSDTPSVETPTSYPTPVNIGFSPCYQVDTAIGMISTDPISFVNNMFDILLSLSGGIALLIIIYNGYRLLISRGNPDAIKKAREGITSGIIGIIFAILSIAILQTIGVDILHLPGFGN